MFTPTKKPTRPMWSPITQPRISTSLDESDDGPLGGYTTQAPEKLHPVWGNPVKNLGTPARRR